MPRSTTATAPSLRRDLSYRSVERRPTRNSQRKSNTFTTANPKPKRKRITKTKQKTRTKSNPNPSPDPSLECVRCSVVCCATAAPTDRCVGRANCERRRRPMKCSIVHPTNRSFPCACVRAFPLAHALLPSITSSSVRSDPSVPFVLSIDFIL